MVFEILSEEGLRKEIVGWTLKNKRSAPLPSSGTAADDFIENFDIPKTDFEFTQSYIGQNGELIVLFKTAIHLSAWQTRNGKEPMDFSYYKVTKAELDENGNISDYIVTGYVITSI